MYNFTKQVSTLKGRVGWQGNSLPENYTLTLSEINQTSDSGLYFDRIGSIVSSKTISETYNTIISDSDTMNTVLERMQEQSISSVLHSIFNEDMVICEAFPFYNANNRLPVAKPIDGDKFIGFKLQPLYLGLTGVFERIALIFDSEIQLPLYLFNSNNVRKGLEVAKKEVTTEAYKYTIIDLSDFAINSEELGGDWYLGYFEEDLGTARAVYYEQDSVLVPNNYILIQQIVIDTEQVEGASSLMLETERSDTYRNGLNPYLAIIKDFSGMIRNNRRIFDRAIQLQMEVDVCRMILNTTRQNHESTTYTERFNQAFLELNGDVERKVFGVESALRSEIKSVRKSLFDEGVIHKATLR